MRLEKIIKIFKGPRHFVQKALLGGALLLLASCTSSLVPKVELPKVELDINPNIKGEVINLNYIAAYSVIAKGVQHCWLADKKPLAKAQFFARTNTKDKTPRSDIYLHKAEKGRKRGPRIISVHLEPKGEATEIRVDNRLLDPLNLAHFNNDIRHWVKGGEGCPAHKNDVEFTPKPVEKKAKPATTKK